MEAADIAEKLRLLIVKWIKLFCLWLLKFAKIRVQKCKLHKAERNLDRRKSRLGAEFYSLYSQGETEFLKSLVILQQLKIVQEAELQKSTVLDRITAIEEEYRIRKQAIANESGH